MTSFTRELAILLDAKILLGDALGVITAQSSDKNIRALSRRLRSEVGKGRPLSDAMEDSHVFGADFVCVVKAGEMSGSLSQAFGDLASLHERRGEIDGKIKSALIYPSILAVTGLASIGIIGAVLVPSIAPIFIQNGTPLPTFVAVVLTLQQNFVVEVTTFLIGVCAIVGLWKTANRNAALKTFMHALHLKVPVFGMLILSREVARFARTLATLLKSGVPIMAGFASATNGVSNLLIKASLVRSLEDLREGSSVAAALERQHVFPPLAIQMVSAGEEIGQLPQLFLRVAALFEERSQRRTDHMLGLLTPILTISIATLVGVLIMSVMSAVLNLNDIAAQ